MYIEIKDIKSAKKILFKEYILNLKKCNNKTEEKYMKLKIKHSKDCLKILKHSFPNLYHKYAIPVLLHDIGRFYEYKKINNFHHEDFGYEYLNKNYTNDPLVLLPIKYHEKDLNWKELLINEKEYKSLSLIKRNEIIECSEILRDIDVISNMKSIAKYKKKTKVKEINLDLLNDLKTFKLAEKESIKNKYDEIVYILCGLNIISQENSWKYLKEHKIIEKLIKLLYKLLDNEDQKNISVTKKIEKIIYEKYMV